MDDLQIISRITRRVQAASVPVGKGFYTGTGDTIHVHRYSNSLQVRDLTLAGKRGKSVPELRIVLNEHYLLEGSSGSDAWFEDTLERLAKCDTWNEFNS